MEGGVLTTGPLGKFHVFQLHILARGPGRGAGERRGAGEGLGASQGGHAVPLSRGGRAGPYLARSFSQGPPVQVGPSHPRLQLWMLARSHWPSPPCLSVACGRHSCFLPRQQQGESSGPGASTREGAALPLLRRGGASPSPHSPTVRPVGGAAQAPPLNPQAYKSASQRSAAPSPRPDQLCRR